MSVARAILDAYVATPSSMLLIRKGIFLYVEANCDLVVVDCKQIYVACSHKKESKVVSSWDNLNLQPSLRRKVVHRSGI